ncbi:hypothetical protein T09_7715 [Trichinella sp. T9]|nr:hypothetical protein T09_7715 [Trichinella sp. T9]
MRIQLSSSVPSTIASSWYASNRFCIPSFHSQKYRNLRAGLRQYHNKKEQWQHVRCCFLISSERFISFWKKVVLPQLSSFMGKSLYWSEPNTAKMYFQISAFSNREMCTLIQYSVMESISGKSPEVWE